MLDDETNFQFRKYKRDFFVYTHTIMSVHIIYLYIIPDASRRPPPTPQDFFGGYPGNLSEGRCSLVRKTAELVVK